MLLAAQHVRHNRTGEEGVNVSAYVHGQELSGVLSRTPQLALDGSLRGQLTFTLHGVARRGALVVSFLDVAFPDGCSAIEVARFIEWFVLNVDAHGGDEIRQEPPFAARFFSQRNEDGVSELASLRSALLPIVGQLETPNVQVRAPQPVRIVQKQGPYGLRFILDPGDRTTLQNVLRRQLPASVGVADETRDAFFDFSPFDLYEAVVAALTTVSADQLDAIGGAEIRDGDTSALFWSSPGHRDSA